MITYPRVSKKFIESTLASQLYDYLLDPCYNLSAILGDIDGYIPSNVAKQVSSLPVVSPGIIMNGDYTPVSSPVLPTEVFSKEISGYAYDIYLMCSSMNLTIISPGSLEDYSPLIKLSTDMLPSIKDALYAIYLECFALYTELVHLNNRMELITRNDISRVCSNISWVSASIEETQNPPYYLISVLRDLERTLLYVKTITPIFSKTYYKAVEEYEQWIEGV